MPVLPLPVLAVLIVGGAAILAAVGLLIVHRIMSRRQYPGENEVAGFLYAVIGVIYGVVLAFIVSSSSGSASPRPIGP